MLNISRSRLWISLKMVGNANLHLKVRQAIPVALFFCYIAHLKILFPKLPRKIIFMATQINKRCTIIYVRLYMLDISKIRFQI